MCQKPQFFQLFSAQSFIQSPPNHLLLSEVTFKYASSDQNFLSNLVNCPTFMREARNHFNSKTIVITCHVVGNKFMCHKFEVFIVNLIRKHPDITAHLPRLSHLAFSFYYSLIQMFSLKISCLFFLKQVHETAQDTDQIFPY